MKRLRRTAGLLALAETAIAGTSLPYNPARLLVPASSSSAYIFQPSADNQFSFGTIDFTKPFDGSNQSVNSISNTLPFLDDKKSIAFTPVLNGGGNLTVLAGDCSDGEKGAEIWRFVPDSDKKSGDGTWTQVKSTNQEDGGSMGSNFLSSGISFSEQIDDDGSDTQVFFFGGMCPKDSGNSTSWAKDASYTNVMLDLAPYGFGDDTEGFDISLVTSRAPPIPEAGFSITPLPPSFTSNSTGDNGLQQQDFVLLGGHTQQAFINMSQVALFSLPQQGWTFIPVTQPSSGKSDLAKRADSSVEPRSGHTTILSEDGNSLILFGGWVGDVNTPATPQLAILELGAGYGGSGDWTWVVPSDTGDGLPSGAGIYGHGAALLPGGVMMVVGGYSISAPSSKRVKRDSQSSNSDVYFFNTTSRAFVSSYQPPGSIKSESSSSGKKHHKGSSSSKAGLGAGLGIGAAALIGLIVFYFWYTRRLKRAREGREQELIGEKTNNGFNGDTAYNGGSQQPFLNGDSEKGPYGAWDGPTPPISPHRQQMDQFDEQRDHAPASGAYVDLPSPTRGLRKPPAGRGYQYHAAPKYDEKGSPVRGGIHPIAEHENEDGHDSRLAERGHAMLSNAERKLLELQTVLHHDPFSDHNNPLRSHPVSPHDFGPDAAAGAAVLRLPPSQQQAARNSKTPVAELEDTSSWQVEPLFTPDVPRDGMGGRLSPTKASERTSSTLSDASIYSAGSLQRTMSTRTGAILQAAAARMTAGKSFDSGTEEYFSPRSVPPRDNSQSPPRHPMGPRSDTKSPSYPSSHTRTSTNGSSRHGRAPGSSGSDVESFSTAKSSNFVHLQNEGQALLNSGGRHAGEYDDNEHTPTATRGRGTYTLPAINQSTRRRGPADIFGSLRRALNVVSMGERSASQTQDPFTDAARASASPSPTKSYGSQSTPRRTTSDGGGRLLSQKRGKKDWEANQRDGNRYRDDPDPGDWGDSPARTSTERRQDAEEDWDVEDAANKRDVQVMFSVPKARLRVVNDDMDRASLRSAPSARSGGALSMRSVSDGGISRSDSLHSDYSQHNRMDTYRRGTPLGQQRSDASLRVQEELRRAPSSAYTLRSRTTATGENDGSTWGGSSSMVEGSLLDSRVEDYYDDKRAVFGSAVGKSKGA